MSLIDVQLAVIHYDLKLILIGEWKPFFHECAGKVWTSDITPLNISALDLNWVLRYKIIPSYWSGIFQRGSAFSPTVDRAASLNQANAQYKVPSWSCHTH